MQERKVREKMRPQDFYTGSLKPELHPVCQGNLSLTLNYFKWFTKFSPLHFHNMQKPHKRLLNHTRVTPAQQEPSCRPRKPPSTHTKPKKDQTWVVAQPNLPQTLSPSFKPSQRLQELIQDQSSTAVNCMITKKRVSTSFLNNFVLKHDQLTSLSKITVFIVKPLRNSTGWFPNQSVDFTWLKWNQSIKK